MYTYIYIYIFIYIYIYIYINIYIYIYIYICIYIYNIYIYIYLRTIPREGWVASQFSHEGFLFEDSQSAALDAGNESLLEWRVLHERDLSL